MRHRLKPSYLCVGELEDKGAVVGEDKIEEFLEAGMVLWSVVTRAFKTDDLLPEPL